MSQDLALRIRAVALLLAASNLLSRLLGYGRDWLINFHFGANGLTDVYQASFTVPDMLNYLLAGGALSVSLMPRMAALYAQEAASPPPPGQLSPSNHTFSVVFTAMLVAALVLVGLAEVFAAPAVAALFHGFTPERIAQTTYLTRIVLPAQLFFLTGGLIQACTMARQDFKSVALTPLIYNFGIIAGGVIGSRSGHIEGFSYGALVGAAIGGLAVPAWMARDRLQYRFLLHLRDPEIRAFLWTALPLMIGVSLTTVDEWIGRYFGSQLAPGSISWLAMARRVMLVPIGLLGTATGQATGAYIARLYAEDKREELSAVLARSLAAVVALSLVLSAAIAALAQPVVGMLFEYGRFGHADSVRTAAALVPLACGIAAWGGQSVLSRALYATGDTWRPMLATTAVTLAMLPVYAFGARWEIVGLACAGTIGMSAQALTLAMLSRARLGLALRPLMAGVGRGLIVAVGAGVAAFAVDAAVAPLCPGARLAYVARLGLAGSAWLLVFVVLATLLHMPGLPRALDRLIGRVVLRRSKPTA